MPYYESNPVFEKRPSSSSALAWVCAIGLISLGLRLSVAIMYAGHPIGRVPWVDEGAYGARAQGILQGAWIPEIPYYQDPLYSYLLAGVMAVFGSKVATIRLVFAVFGALTPLVVFSAVRRGFGSAEAVASGLLTAFCGPLIFADVSLGKEGPAALAAAVALFVASRQKSSCRPMASSVWSGVEGFAWGLVALLRSNALLLAPLGMLRHIRNSSRGRLLIAAGFGLGFAIVIMPLVLINRAVSDPPEWIVTTWQAGPNFYIGNNPGATAQYEAPSFVEANPARGRRLRDGSQPAHGSETHL